MARSAAEIEGWLIQRISTMVRLPEASLDRNANFDTYALDSAKAMEMVGDLEQWLGTRIDPVAAWEHPSVAALAAHLAKPEEL
ncbi:MAG: acyl carrier protein [Myxococcales bacterium]|nr:acyl carrier protein [Myxococcales bacterium]